MNKSPIISQLFRSNTLFSYVKTQYFDSPSYLFHKEKVLPEILFSFEKPRDISDIWEVSTNDYNPYTNQLHNCSYSFNEKSSSLVFQGKIIPDVLSEDEQFMYGYCNVRTKLLRIPPFKLYPIMDLDIYSHLEIVYRGDFSDENVSFINNSNDSDNKNLNDSDNLLNLNSATDTQQTANSSSFEHLPYAKKCLFNVYVKTSVVSIPSIFQCQFEVLPGWNKLVVPFNVEALKYVKETWYDYTKLFEPSRICMFGFNFVTRDVEKRFKFELRSITAVPRLDSSGLIVDTQIWEREPEPHYQISLEENRNGKSKEKGIDLMREIC